MEAEAGCRVRKEVEYRQVGERVDGVVIASKALAGRFAEDAGKTLWFTMAATTLELAVRRWLMEVGARI